MPALTSFARSAGREYVECSRQGTGLGHPWPPASFEIAANS
jgi:hypothetical protein